MRHLAALGAVKLAGADDLLKLALELDDTLLQHAAVGFDLGFAGAAHEARTTALTFKVGPGADQTALLVIEMREIDLQRAFLGGGAAAKDFEDEAGTVDDLGAPFLFEIALLNRRQRMVDDDEAGILLVEKRLDLLDLAGAHQRRRARLVDRHDQAFGNRQIDGAGKSHRLFEAGLVGALRGWLEKLLGSGLIALPVSCGTALAGLFQDRHDDGRTHVVPVLFSLRDQRFIRGIAAGNFDPSLSSVFFGFEHLQRLAGHDGRDRVLIHELRVSVTTKQNAEVVKRRDNTRQFNAVDQKDRQGDLLLAYGIEEKILKVLRTFRHGAASFFLADRQSETCLISEEISGARHRACRPPSVWLANHCVFRNREKTGSLADPWFTGGKRLLGVPV